MNLKNLSAASQMNPLHPRPSEISRLGPVEDDNVADPVPSDGAPLTDLEEWDEFLRQRYPEEGNASSRSPSEILPVGREQQAFRNYQTDVKPGVREFYRLNHRHQTLDFVLEKKRTYLPLNRQRMGMWEALEFLNTLVDDSDPDTALSQIEHSMQTAEAIRRDGHPRWFMLTGLIHDLGKVLCLYGEPQWAVVGDTFPVGCAYSPKVVFPEFFAENPDSHVPTYQTHCGVYEEGCGLDSVHLSWGHDEYLYQVVKDYLSEPALAMIRYHSFYAAHREGAYEHLMNAHDLQMFSWVRAFNPYDLYSKGATRPDVAGLTPFYQELISEYFPPVVRW
jgi:inositol oxygenase